MKKKIVAMCATVAIAALAVGGTLAYFTDTDAKTNVFTTGNVDITLEETFNEKNLKLTPGVKIQKEVTVKNEGSEPAYVRVHVAVPAVLDSGSEDKPEFAAYNNTLHINWDGASAADGQWTQFPTTTETGPNASYPNWPANGGNYNFYQTTINGIDYNVYVYTYESPLAAGKSTETNAISQMYLDTKVTNEQIAKLKEAGVIDNNNQIKVYVFAEGGQQDTFTDACVALNTQFGATDGVDGIVWTLNADGDVVKVAYPAA